MPVHIARHPYAARNVTMLQDHSESRLEAGNARCGMGRAGDEACLKMDMSSARAAPMLAVPPVSPLPVRRFAVLAVRVGATASLLCAVHCALLPFVLALLPLVGLGFLAGHAFERVFVACAAALASASIVTAYRRHRRPQALFLMLPGIALLVFGIVVNIDVHVVFHTVAVVCGGVLVAGAHVTNLALAHRHHHANCTHATA